MKTLRWNRMGLLLVFALLLSGCIPVKSIEKAWAKAKETPEYAAVTDRTDFIDFAGITEEEYAVYDLHVPLATVEHAVEHVDRALQVMGTDHVGLGTDFDGARRFPEGLEHAGKLPFLTAGLLDRGWKETELEGLLGKNLLEYFRRVIG